MAAGAYDIHSEEIFAGSLANAILTHGAGTSRLRRYLRVERGLVYDVQAGFEPTRHGGEFSANTELDPANAGAAIEGMFKVFAEMGKDGVGADELNDARLATVGRMLMNMQTISEQGGYRVEAILNDFPADAYEQYAQRYKGVTGEQVRQVMAKYVRPERMITVVVGPANVLKPQLKRFGPVEVSPTP
jgi:zinc protease